jgi:hypothetical protein
MVGNRYYHTATLLDNGKVLICGGFLGSSTLSTAELFDPDTNTFTSTGTMNTSRQYHTATKLPNGKVLILGGYDKDSNSSLQSTEIYDPSTGTFSAGPNLALKKHHHTATPLANGNIYVIGGVSSSLSTTSSELYSYSSNQFQTLSSLNQSRYQHTTVLLQTGKLIVMGGNQSINSQSYRITKSSELYNDTFSRFVESNSMSSNRSNHSAILLNTGTVLVTGGELQNGGVIAPLSSAELYMGEPKIGTSF